MNFQLLMVFWMVFCSHIRAEVVPSLLEHYSLSMLDLSLDLYVGNSLYSHHYPTLMNSLVLPPILVVHRLVEEWDSHMGE